MTGQLAGLMMASGLFKGARAAIFIALASVSDKHGESWHAFDSIGLRAHCARSTVIKHIQYMERIGIVMVTRGVGLPTKSGKRTKNQPHPN